MFLQLISVIFTFKITLITCLDYVGLDNIMLVLLFMLCLQDNKQL